MFPLHNFSYSYTHSAFALVVESHTITAHRIQKRAQSAVACMKSEFNRKTRNNYASLIFYETYGGEGAPFQRRHLCARCAPWKLIPNGEHACKLATAAKLIIIIIHFCEIRFVDQNCNFHRVCECVCVFGGCRTDHMPLKVWHLVWLSSKMALVFHSVTSFVVISTMMSNRRSIPIIHR